MLFNKAMGLAVHNWKVMVKALICQILILALIIALCYLIFGSFVDDVINVLAAGEWGKFLSETVESVANATFNGNDFAEKLAANIEKTQQAIEAIPNIWNRVEVSYVSFIALLLLYRILISFSDVAVSFQLEEFLTSNTARPFTWFLAKKFGESCKFSLLQMAVTLPLDILVLLGSTGICLIFVLTLKWWSIIPAVFILLILYSARLAYFAFWLPAISADNLTVSQAFKKGLATIPYRFWQVFWKTFVMICLMAAIFLASVLYLQNHVLKFVLSVVPNLILFFLLKCVNFVEYFENAHRPYFVKYVDVEGTERYNKKQARKNKRGAKA